MYILKEKPIILIVDDIQIKVCFNIDDQSNVIGYYWDKNSVYTEEIMSMITERIF